MATLFASNMTNGLAVAVNLDTVKYLSPHPDSPQFTNLTFLDDKHMTITSPMDDLLQAWGGLVTRASRINTRTTAKFAPARSRWEPDLPIVRCSGVGLQRVEHLRAYLRLAGLTRREASVSPPRCI